MSENTTYRIRTELNQTDPTVLNVHLDQTYDSLEILTLKLDQTNSYKLFESGFGVICGRVTCSGFGIPNAKIGVFIQVDDNATVKERLIYNYSSTSSTNNDGVVYNLLPNFVDNKCHQDVGTFPSKRQWLDSNETTVQIYEDYYQFTTTSGPCGDFMIICPSGNAILHCDVDLSDIGTYLSQRPLDMEAKGYSASQFDSPNKFKKSTNLRELSQLYSQDKGLYVYPYWGEQSELGENIAITRCDYDISYTFTPTAIFMGSAITDKGNNAINQKCKPAKKMGKMSELAASSGTINMIRKTPSGKVEQYQIEGDQLIDNDGIWCYQIPMNLDYVKMDEFGNIVPTDDVENGLPTRARVRFRFTLNDTTEDTSARKRCSYLVPNNPRIDGEHFPKFTENLEPDYEFGSLTNEESFKDLFWNNVYTVKSYIPKLQTSDSVKNRAHTGIKWTSFYEGNNPFPFNSMVIRKTIVFSALCTIIKIIKDIITFVNQVLTLVGIIPCLLYSFLNAIYNIKILGIRIFAFIKPFRDAAHAAIPSCIKLGAEFCDDEVNRKTYFPGCGKILLTGVSADWLSCVWGVTTERFYNGEYEDSEDQEDYESTITEADNASSTLVTCFENQLIQENEIVAFNFVNDWINGCLYFPLWYRRIKNKHRIFFGLFHTKARDEWCASNQYFSHLRLHQNCIIEYENKEDTYPNYVGTTITPYTKVAPTTSTKYHEKDINKTGQNGVIIDKETILGDTVYYYSSLVFDNSLAKNDYVTYGTDKKGEVLLLFATDIVLLGNIQECNMYGIPQFFEHLVGTTYNLPNDILDLDTEAQSQIDGDKVTMVNFDKTTTETGCDWGNKGDDQCGDSEDGDGGLFYSLGCSKIKVKQKSCLNLMRICEYGVMKDTIQTIENLSELSGNENAEGDELTPDGFISYDELSNYDQRAMFATMNSNNLFVKYNNKNGFYEYDLHYLYPNNWEGALYDIMQERQAKKCDANYKNNYNLETYSQDYYNFRMGETPYFYKQDGNKMSFPRFENSFYFYFGLTEGKTALNKFNDNYYAPCEDLSGETDVVSVTAHANDWCSEVETGEESKNGYIEIDATTVETPYSISLNSTSNTTVGFEIEGLTDERIVICNSCTYGTLTEGGNYEYENPESCQFNVPNGDYEMTITDANGESVTLAFTMKNKYLNYQVNSLDFTVGNDTLLDNYGSYGSNNGSEETCVANAKDDGGCVNADFAYRCNIGGVLKIENVYYDNDPLSDFKLTVYTDEFSDSSYTPPFVVVKNGSQVSNGGDGVLTTEGPYNGIDKPIYIGLPYGGVFYTVEITQQCNGIDSNNTVKQEVFVNKAIDLKLYINDIDYGLISQWEGGVNKNGNVSNEVNDKLSGWIEMSNDLSYNWANCDEAKTLLDTLTETLEGWTNVTITIKKSDVSSFREALTVYLLNGDWPFTLCNTDDTYENCIVNTFISNDVFEIEFNVDGTLLTDDDVEEIKTTIYNAIVEFQDFKQTTKETVKQAFIFSCSDYTKSLYLRGETSNDNYPLTYYIWGREEMEDEETLKQTLAEDVSEPLYLGEDGDDGITSISTIGIPTISTTDSEDFGNDEYTFTGQGYPNLCVATDNSATNFKDKRKFAYYVAVKDQSGSTIPTDAAKTINSSNDEMFVVHFIDKMISYDLITWGTFNNMYYYGKEDTDSCPINMNGFVGGLIKNGITVSTDSDGKATFYEQTIGNESVEIYNLQTDDGHYNGWYEDQFPTERVFITDIDLNDPEKCFGPYGYQVDSSFSKISQCALLSAQTSDISIIDSGGCGIGTNAYGNKKVAMRSYSADDEGNLTITVLATNGEGDDTYYIYNANTHTYPLNDIVMEYDNGTEEDPNEPCTVISKAYIDMTDKNEAWEDPNGSIFSYKTTEDVLKTYVDIDAQSTTEVTDDDGITTPEETFGYGTTGVFMGIDPNTPIYIVAVDSTNSRAISPVYDFTTPIVKLDWKTEDDKYYFGITIANPPYYLKTYNSTVVIDCQGITSGTINDAGPFTDGNGAYYEISESTYNTISNYNITHITEPLKDITTVKITDCVKVEHTCTVNG